MIKVGDKVKFLNDVGGGVVTGFVSKNVVNVENEDGFEIPCPVTELLNVSDPGLNVRLEKTPESAEPVKTSDAVQIQKPQGEIINGKNNPDFYFCFVPTVQGNALEGEIELFLVNDSNFTLLYRFSTFENDKNLTVKYGTVESNSKVLLDSLEQSDLSEIPDFGFQLVYFRAEEKIWNEPVVKRFKVNPVKFYKESTFVPNNFFRKNALIFQITKDILTTKLDNLTQDDFQKVVREKEKEQIVEPAPPKRTKEIVEIDLHINELIDSAKGLSNHEILELQKEKVELEMKLAIQNQVEKIVFIHGVGQGVLKQEVLNLLKKKYGKYYFQDASFREYGYGATMVILKRGK